MRRFSPFCGPHVTSLWLFTQAPCSQSNSCILNCQYPHEEIRSDPRSSTASGTVLRSLCEAAVHRFAGLTTLYASRSELLCMMCSPADIVWSEKGFPVALSRTRSSCPVSDVFWVEFFSCGRPCVHAALMQPRIHVFLWFIAFHDGVQATEALYRPSVHRSQSNLSPLPSLRRARNLLSSANPEYLEHNRKPEPFAHVPTSLVQVTR